MSRRLTSSRLVEQLQRETEDAFYSDTGVLIQLYDPDNVTYDAAGQPIEDSTETEVQCSFTDEPAMEKWASYADIEEIEAEVRYTGPKPAKGNQFRLVNMYDRNVAAANKYTEQLFEIVDIRDRDAFGYLVALKQVQI
jgi:hypothetical protein